MSGKKGRGGGKRKRKKKASAEMRKIGRQLISDADFAEGFSMCLDWARETVEGRESITPRVFVHDSSGGISMCVLTVMDERRYKLMAGMGMNFAHQGTELACAYLVAEAWLTKRTAQQREEERRRGETVEDQPDKREVLLICGLTLDERQATTIIEIERDEQGLIRLKKMTETGLFLDNSMGENDLLSAFFSGYAQVIAADQVSVKINKVKGILGDTGLGLN